MYRHCKCQQFIHTCYVTLIFLINKTKYNNPILNKFQGSIFIIALGLPRIVKSFNDFEFMK